MCKHSGVKSVCEQRTRGVKSFCRQRVRRWKPTKCRIIGAAVRRRDQLRPQYVETSQTDRILTPNAQTPAQAPNARRAAGASSQRRRARGRRSSSWPAMACGAGGRSASQGEPHDRVAAGAHGGASRARPAGGRIRAWRPRARAAARAARWARSLTTF
jgi:hypothetical protein